MIPLDGFSLNLIFECFFSENMWTKFKFDGNMTRITGTLHEDLRTFMIISGTIFLNEKYFRQNLWRKSKNTFCVQ